MRSFVLHSAGLVAALGPVGESGPAPVAAPTPETPPSIAAELHADPRAAGVAEELVRLAGWTVTVEEPYTMDGGWRGMVRIVPHWPTGSDRVHLERVRDAAKDYAALFADIEATHYRWRDLELRFFESVKRATPSAYAVGWQVAYNVKGSLLRSSTGVRRTLFHEIFHLNDEAHGDWSWRALTDIYKGITKRCTGRTGLDNACLEPFAPTSTKVKGSVYYAFHPGQDVREYGAELATRWYDEQHAVLLEGKAPAHPFKCRNPQNAMAWAAIVHEMFNDFDRTGDCPVPH